MRDDTGDTRARLARELIMTLDARHRRHGVMALPSGSGPAVESRQRRRQPRFARPRLGAVIGGSRFAVLDWSLGGLRIGSFDGDVRIGAKLDLLLEIRPHQLPAVARVKRFSRQSRELAVAFASLPAETEAALNRLKRAELATGAGALDDLARGAA